MPHSISLHDGEVQIKLANGEKVYIALDEEGPLGVAPCLRFKVSSDRGTLLMQPSADNCVVITTPKALRAMDQLVDAVMASRKKA